MGRSTFLDDIAFCPLKDFSCLNDFCSGVEAMDEFIRGDFRLSVENHYCVPYATWYQGELVAVFAVGFYGRCGFTAAEAKKPYKDTLRMYMTLYAKADSWEDEE